MASKRPKPKHSVLRKRLEEIGPATELLNEIRLWNAKGGPFPYRRLGYGLSFSYYWRTQPKFYDAIRKWRGDRPPDTEETAADKKTEALKRKLANEILKALGPERDNFEAAEVVLHAEYERLLRKAPGSKTAQLFGIQLEEIVFPLLHVYRNPVQFFREEAGDLDPEGFSADGAGRVWIRTLRRFGFAALWNSNVRGVFAAAPEHLSPEKLIVALAMIEQRDAYKEGAPEGATKGRPKPGRPKKGDSELRPGSQERRILRAGKRKRGK